MNSHEKEYSYFDKKQKWISFCHRLIDPPNLAQLNDNIKEPTEEEEVNPLYLETITSNHKKTNNCYNKLSAPNVFKNFKQDKCQTRLLGGILKSVKISDVLKTYQIKTESGISDDSSDYSEKPF